MPTCSLLVNKDYEKYLKFCRKFLITEELTKVSYTKDEIEKLKKMKDVEILKELKQIFKRTKKHPIDDQLFDCVRRMKYRYADEEIFSKIRNADVNVIFEKLNTTSASRRMSIDKFDYSEFIEHGISIHKSYDSFVLDKSKLKLLNLCDYKESEGDSFLSKYNLTKVPDYIVSIYDNVFVGERKFISMDGGAQNQQILDAVSFLDRKDGFCIIDGSPQIFAMETRRILKSGYGKEKKSFKDIMKHMASKNCFSMYDFLSWIQEKEQELK